jgi:uncharacterized membrane protein YeaQ/YmgE (transglycosylase-associated protein family)
MSAYSFLFNIYVIAVGVIAGLLAGLVGRRGSFGFLGDIAAGVIGGFIGGWLLPLPAIVVGVDLRDDGIAAVGIAAFLGAVILLGLLRLIER